MRLLALQASLLPIASSRPFLLSAVFESSVVLLLHSKRNNELFF